MKPTLRKKFPFSTRKVRSTVCRIGKEQGCIWLKGQVKKKLEEAYQNGGGFEIICSGYPSRKSLVVLRPPVSVGHLIQFLRDGSGLGQALAYIRPLQNL